MDIEQIRTYCLSKKGTTESFPFDAHTLVFKVAGKMYALCALERFPVAISLKCEPDYALELREKFPNAISGAYHMNKKHWNAVLPELLNPKTVQQLIDDSYRLVVTGLPKKTRDSLVEN
ncbi:MAG: MmcQ/YjbR family DNA-binding protein [Bacteroidetes bacterium]|nr:MmcQ/YjbR family DNA-binding protein [Bacteroidota bacterium]